MLLFHHVQTHTHTHTLQNDRSKSPHMDLCVCVCVVCICALLLALCNSTYSNYSRRLSFKFSRHHGNTEPQQSPTHTLHTHTGKKIKKINKWNSRARGCVVANTRMHACSCFGARGGRLYCYPWMSENLNATRQLELKITLWAPWDSVMLDCSVAPFACKSYS